MGGSFSTGGFLANTYVPQLGGDKIFPTENFRTCYAQCLLVVFHPFPTYFSREGRKTFSPQNSRYQLRIKPSTQDRAGLTRYTRRFIYHPTILFGAKSFKSCSCYRLQQSITSTTSVQYTFLFPFPTLISPSTHCLLNDIHGFNALLFIYFTS